MGTEGTDFPHAVKRDAAKIKARIAAAIFVFIFISLPGGVSAGTIITPFTGFFKFFVPSRIPPIEKKAVKGRSAKCGSRVLMRKKIRGFSERKNNADKEKI